MRMSGGRQRGAAAVELPLLLGLVILPFAILVLAIPQWVEHQTAARDAAAEIARWSVVRPGGDNGGHADQEALLRRIEATYELRPGSLSLVGAPSGPVGPGDAVTVRVEVDLLGPTVPGLGSLGLGRWTAEHTERLPDYAGRRDR